MIIDTHAHVFDPKIENSEAAIKRAGEVGINKIVVPTTSIEDLDKVIRLAQNQKDLYILAGVHPEEIETVTNIQAMKSELKNRIIANKKVVGIGEIGLDFFYDKERFTKTNQIEIFQAQMELAVEMNLPVAIHMREAQEEMLAVLGELKALPKGQFHCFAGDQGFLKRILDLGFYVSFAGNITYKSAQNLRDRLKEVPLERLLVETDSPYLAPEPLRGTINEPANVKIIAKFIALELNLDLAEISEITQKNTLCLYSLDI
jgi:TatD DNase family protein